MSDSLVIENEYGKITIAKSVISQTAADVIKETEGVALSGSRKRIAGRSGIDVDFDSDGIPEIRAYVIVDLGTSISNATYSIINEIKNRVTMLLERSPSSITVIVAGTRTSKTVIRRKIEVRREYDSTDR